MTNPSTRQHEVLRNFPASHIKLALALFAFIVAISLFIPGKLASQEPETLALANFSQSATASENSASVIEQALAQDPGASAKLESKLSSESQGNADAVQASWKTRQIKSGDNLSSIFKAEGFSPQDVYRITQVRGKERILSNLAPGQSLHFYHDDDNRLLELKYQLSDIEHYHYQLQADNRFEISHNVREYERNTQLARGTIEQSLFTAAQKSGLSDTLTMDLANIFGWDIDFALDIRSGDYFELMYEELYLDGKKVKDGNILAATFYNDGRKVTALRYQDEHGNVDYFTPAGKSMRKEFLRSPVNFARISSRFNLRRKHPVLHKIRAHKGVDYAASRGTPIKSTGDGKVIWAGRKGGYGKVIIIQHGQKYSTLYAHLNGYARGIRSGRKVKQGQTIGYVGSTGLATGPHLHYEFRVNGVHKNPLTVKLPRVEPIAEHQKANFLAAIEGPLRKLTRYGASNTLALLDDE